MQTYGIDTLRWVAGTRLTFENFNGTPKDSTLTFDGYHKGAGLIREKIVMTMDTVDEKVVFTVFACMDQSGSWIRDKSDSTTLLHEQGHFDLSEWYARVMRKYLAGAKTVEQADWIYRQFTDKKRQEQALYDKDQLGEIGISESWKQSIEDRLRKFDKYSNPVVVSKIKVKRGKSKT